MFDICVSHGLWQTQGGIDNWWYWLPRKHVMCGIHDLEETYGR